MGRISAPPETSQLNTLQLSRTARTERQHLSDIPTYLELAIAYAFERTRRNRAPSSRLVHLLQKA